MKGHGRARLNPCLDGSGSDGSAVDRQPRFPEDFGLHVRDHREHYRDAGMCDGAIFIELPLNLGA